MGELVFDVHIIVDVLQDGTRPEGFRCAGPAEVGYVSGWALHDHHWHNGTADEPSHTRTPLRAAKLKRYDRVGFTHSHFRTRHQRRCKNTVLRGLSGTTCGAIPLSVHCKTGPISRRTGVKALHQHAIDLSRPLYDEHPRVQLIFNGMHLQ